jgi:diguanylate cyclase (GGDEF)-like protein
MMDIDYFKAYNDNYGHVAGDDCLKLVAQALSRSLTRGGDFVARYGGEEFVALLTDTGEAGAIAAAGILQREIKNLRIEHSSSSAANRITLSMGTATTIPRANSSPKDLIKAADRALYEAKEGGRNQVRSCKL